MDAAARDLGTERTGWGIKQGKTKINRLREALAEDTLAHTSFEEEVRASATSLFPHKSTLGHMSLHGPSHKPHDDARYVFLNDCEGLHFGGILILSEILFGRSAFR